MGATHFEPADHGTNWHTGKAVVKSGAGYMDGDKPAVARIGIVNEKAMGSMLARTYLNRAEAEAAVTELTKLLYQGKAADEEDGHMAKHFLEAYVLCRIRGDKLLMERAILGGRAVIEVIADELGEEFRSTMIRLGRLFEANERV